MQKPKSAIQTKTLTKILKKKKNKNQYKMKSRKN